MMGVSLHFGGVDLQDSTVVAQNVLRPDKRIEILSGEQQKRLEGCGQRYTELLLQVADFPFVAWITRDPCLAEARHIFLSDGVDHQMPLWPNDKAHLPGPALRPRS